jgi:hypothetical protein
MVTFQNGKGAVLYSSIAHYGGNTSDLLSFRLLLSSSYTNG